MLTKDTTLDFETGRRVNPERRITPSDTFVFLPTGCNRRNRVRRKNTSPRRQLVSRRSDSDRRRNPKADCGHMTANYSSGEFLDRALVHQAKNDIHRCASIFQMALSESDWDKTESMQTAIRQVHAMATSYDHLNRSAGATGYVSGLKLRMPLSETVCANGNAKVTYKGTCDPWLPHRMIVAILMVAQELVSNAIKYGEGEIIVEFNQVEANFVLSVTGHGQKSESSVDPYGLTGMGIALIKGLVKTDLGGSLESATTSGGGVTAIVTFPCK